MGRTHRLSIGSTALVAQPTRRFDYLFEGESVPAIGQLVVIPFGPRQVIGVVRDNHPTTPAPKIKLKAITRVLDLPPLPARYLALADWLGQHYAASPRAVWQNLLPSGLQLKARVQASPQDRVRRKTSAQDLNAEQARVYAAIKAQSVKPALIQGITGAGKTHIYEALINDCLSRGESAIVLAPEIILTRHLASRWKDRYGQQLVMTHSGLTAAGRRNIWTQALKETTPHVYVGPRSTLFLPLQKLGLIIIDEEHDGSYKQEQAPRYQASHVAAWLHKTHAIPLVLGSATPSVTTLALADQDSITKYRLDERFGEAQLPEVKLIEHRQRDGVIAPALLGALRESLKNGQQAMILINRRGTARRLSCDDCGQSVSCSHCDTPLVFHADEGRLRCHICDQSSFPPTRCPECSSSELHYRGVGTKRVIEALKLAVPDARLGRLDRDSSQSDSEAIITAMQAGSLDILVGTQMIAKGLDFARVSCVGIINGDELVTGSDWASTEQGVSLMMQAAGRAGRAQTAGQVFIQTHRPAEPALQAVKQHNWDSFAQTELTRRQKFGYPPYRWMARLTLRRKTQANAETKAQELANSLRQMPDLEVLGPAIPLLARVGAWHNVQIVLKSKRRGSLLKACQNLDADWTIDLDPNHIL